MNLTSLLKSIALALLLTMSVAARTNEEGAESGEKARSMAAESDVVVSVCLASGDVVVRGWDRSEVRARSEAEGLELRRARVANGQGSAKSIEVVVSDAPDGEEVIDECSGTHNLQLDVPRGATVVVKLRDGRIDATDVGEARLETLSGDIEVRRISKLTEASSLSGHVFLRDVSGRTTLRAVSGDIDAADARPNEVSDFFSAKSVSGDVILERISHSRVEAGTVSGDVSLTGTLARGGNYSLLTTSGDVTVTLPPDASLRVSAKVAMGGEIVTDFPVRSAGGADMSKEISAGRLSGSIGTGDAEVSLSSFSGTVHLRKSTRSNK